MAQFIQIYTEAERIKMKNSNIKAIKKALKNVPEETIKLNEKLIDEAATYATTLAEINKTIERDGFVDTYQNGENQWGTKKSVAAEMKPKYTATYQSLIKQLTELIPDDGDDDLEKEFFQFVNNK